MAKSKRKKAQKEETKETTVIHFADAVNYTEVAAILSEKVNRLCVNSKELSFLAAEDGFDIYKFADVLNDMIDFEMLNELMVSEVGQGILIGIYLMRSAEVDEKMYIDELEAQENE